MQIVIIDHGDGKPSYRGPFSSLYEAEQFAAWATTNIDPAHTRPLGAPLLDMLCADVYTETGTNQCPSVTRHYGGGLIKCDGLAGHVPDHSHRDAAGALTAWRDEISADG